MRHNGWYMHPRLKRPREKEGPTWPEDTEYMISVALTLKKDPGGE